MRQKLDLIIFKWLNKARYRFEDTLWRLRSERAGFRATVGVERQINPSLAVALDRAGFGPRSSWWHRAALTSEAFDILPPPPPPPQQQLHIDTKPSSEALTSETKPRRGLVTQERVRSTTTEKMFFKKLENREKKPQTGSERWANGCHVWLTARFQKRQRLLEQNSHYKPLKVDAVFL